MYSAMSASDHQLAAYARLSPPARRRYTWRCSSGPSMRSVPAGVPKVVPTAVSSTRPTSTLMSVRSCRCRVTLPSLSSRTFQLGVSRAGIVPVLSATSSFASHRVSSASQGCVGGRPPQASSRPYARPSSCDAPLRKELGTSATAPRRVIRCCFGPGPSGDPLPMGRAVASTTPAPARAEEGEPRSAGRRPQPTPCPHSARRAASSISPQARRGAKRAPACPCAAGRRSEGGPVLRAPPRLAARLI
mmetsp:Transcript_24718/g.84550  ORF Transcript_24718/g.84550 Transcript_24718/m.84550 type:complete len:246 (-) Transcript_24718:48-785(-)